MARAVCADGSAAYSPVVTIAVVDYIPAEGNQNLIDAETAVIR